MQYIKVVFDAVLYVQIDNYICGSLGSDVPFLLVAGAGSGKSSVLAKAADMASTKALYAAIPKYDQPVCLAGFFRSSVLV